MLPSTHPKRIPYLKTLRWDSQALCERERDESCFLTCGETWCWNLSSQLLLYCDILLSNFPYSTESDALLISAAPLQTLTPLMHRWDLCFVICTVSDCNWNRTAYEFSTLWTQRFWLSWGDLLSNWSKRWTKSVRIETAACMCVFEGMWETTVCFCVTQKWKKWEKEAFDPGGDRKIRF